MDKAQNGDIDISLVLKTLSDGKWKIISFILFFFTITLVYTLSTQEIFRVTSILKKTNQNLYFKYKYLNDILMPENDASTDPIFISNNPTPKQNFLKMDYTRVFQIDEQLIFKMFD